MMSTLPAATSLVPAMRMWQWSAAGDVALMLDDVTFSRPAPGLHTPLTLSRGCCSLINPAMWRTWLSPEIVIDLKGVFLAGFTSVCLLLGITGALVFGVLCSILFLFCTSVK